MTQRIASPSEPSGPNASRRGRLAGGPSLAWQITGLLLGGLVVAQGVTLLLTLVLPPEPPPQYELRDIARTLAAQAGSALPGTLERTVEATPPQPSGPGWLTSDKSRRELAGLLGRRESDVRLFFYTPLPFAGTASAMTAQPPHGAARAPRTATVAAASVVVVTGLVPVDYRIAQAPAPAGPPAPAARPPGPPPGSPPLPLPPRPDNGPPPGLQPPPGGPWPIGPLPMNPGLPSQRLRELPMATPAPPQGPRPDGAATTRPAGDAARPVLDRWPPPAPEGATAVQGAPRLGPDTEPPAPADGVRRSTEGAGPGAPVPRDQGAVAATAPADATARPVRAAPAEGGKATAPEPAREAAARVDAPWGAAARPGAGSPQPPGLPPRARTGPAAAYAAPDARAAAGTRPAPPVATIDPVDALRTPEARRLPPPPTAAPDAAASGGEQPALRDAVSPGGGADASEAAPRAGRTDPPATAPIASPARERALFGLGPAPFVQGDFLAAMALPDGRWSVVRPAPEPFPNAWQRRVLLWFLVAAAIVGPLGWLYARRLVRPLSGFARAAEQLGRDPTAPILALAGPAEVGRAAQAFNRMQSRLRSFVDDRTAMIGAISHDLRTPLTRMRFRIEDAPDELRAGMLQDVEEMETMISSVLAFIRDASEPGTREVLDLSSIVEDVVEDAVFVGRQVTLVDTRPAAVDADAIGLRRLLGNLIENAVKYGDRAQVRLYTDRQDAVAEIRDEGPGLPDDELERVFQPFYRTPAARASGRQGSGLGLAVCRSIARAHGGDVHLARGERGLVAQLRLPLAFGGG